LAGSSRRGRPLPSRVSGAPSAFTAGGGPGSRHLIPYSVERAVSGFSPPDPYCRAGLLNVKFPLEDPLVSLLLRGCHKHVSTLLDIPFGKGRREDPVTNFARRGMDFQGWQSRKHERRNRGTSIHTRPQRTPDFHYFAYRTLRNYYRDRVKNFQGTPRRCTRPVSLTKP